MDMADRKEPDFFRRLRSAERLRERAMASGSAWEKTPFSKSMASLVSITRFDQRRAPAGLRREAVFPEVVFMAFPFRAVDPGVDRSWREDKFPAATGPAPGNVAATSPRPLFGVPETRHAGQ